MMSRWFTVAAASLFGAYVVHAAVSTSARCPVVGTCASIHLQMLRGATPLSRAGLVPAAAHGRFGLADLPVTPLQIARAVRYP